MAVSRGTADKSEGSGKDALSARDLEVLLLTARAMTNGQIASCLHISEGTVKRPLTTINAKLGVSSGAYAAKRPL